MGLLGREFDHRNKYQKLIDELSQNEHNEIQLQKLYQNLKLPKILELLENEDPSITNRFYHLLIDLNDQQTLIKLLKYKDVDVRSSAAKTLGQMGEPVAKKTLIIALKDKRSDIRSNVVLALGEIGPDAKIAVPVLI